ncbi:MAG: Flp family type IVb pilin [Alphaproteobacteria bacterium]
MSSSMFPRFLKNESGATAIEYAMLAALIAMACVGTLRLISNHVSNMYTNVSNDMTNAVE